MSISSRESKNFTLAAQKIFSLLEKAICGYKVFKNTKGGGSGGDNCKHFEK